MIPCPKGWFCSKDGLDIPDKLSKGGYVSTEVGRIDKDYYYKNDNEPKKQKIMEICKATTHCYDGTYINKIYEEKNDAPSLDDVNFGMLKFKKYPVLLGNTAYYVNYQILIEAFKIIRCRD